jgi:hypothetical protein
MTNKAKGKIRRKILVVDKAFQMAFIFRFWALVVCGAVLAGLIIYLTCGRSVTTVFQHSRLKIMSTSDFILPGFLLSSLVVIVVVGTATAFVALLTSHRIAGPVYRLRQDLVQFRSGELRQTFRLRPLDELRPLAEEIDLTARKIGGDVTSLQLEARLLERMGSALPPAASECVKNMKRILDQYHA